MRFTETDAENIAREVSEHMPADAKTVGAVFDCGAAVGVAIELPNGRRYAVRMKDPDPRVAAMALNLWIEDTAA